METILKTIKELRILIALIITITGTSAFNYETTMGYIYNYNIHLAVLIIIVGYLNHFLSTKRHNCMEIRIDSQEGQLKKVILEGSISQLKAEVRQAFKDYSDIEEIDFITTIKYIKGLNERRVSLGVNSYTEDMMMILLKKIKIS